MRIISTPNLALTPRLASLLTPLLVLVLTLASVAFDPAHARGPRNFPAKTYQIKVTAISNYGYFKSGSTVFKMAPGVVIYNENNRSVVRSRLPVGAYVRIQFQENGDVRRIWILDRDEILIKAPPPKPPVADDNTDDPDDASQ